MIFDPPLVPATLVQRYKRFLFDAVLDDGTAITGSCPNTGSMRGLTTPGSRIWLSEHDDIDWTVLGVERGEPLAWGGLGGVGAGDGHEDDLIALVVELVVIAGPRLERGVELVPEHAVPISGVYLATMAQVYPEDRGTNYAIRDGRKVARLLAEALAKT